jgi:DNA helicase-2/ATP-dependent DNA helicase PcrA
MMDLNKLNPYQKEAVLDESPACLVNANVGSGKTTVLTAKVRYLCEQKGVAPKDLMVLTFTNKAANEIRERLENLTGKEEDLWFGTFHSVALRMLQTILPVEELGYTKEFQVCIPEEEMQMAQQLITEQNLQIKYKNCLKKRLDQSRQKSGRKPKDYGDDFERLCTLLEEEKKKQNKMTYEELILHTGQLLQSHPEILRPLWLIIDEVQDCDQSQLDLLDSLMGKDSHLFAVGDPNQVIYSWRGSAFQIFFQLKNRYQAMELSLPINYRSSGTILSAARRFLQNGSTLEGVKSEGGKVQIRKQYDPFQEAEDLAARIRELHMQGIPYHEIGILYRLQNQSALLEQVLTRNGIPVHVAVKEKMEDIPVVQWFFHVLRFCVNHSDTTSGVEALCNKTYGEGWTTKKALQQIRRWETEETLPKDSPLFSGMVNVQEDVFVTEETDQLWEMFSLDRYLMPSRAGYREDKVRIMGIFAGIREKGSVREFLNDVALYGIPLLYSVGKTNPVAENQITEDLTTNCSNTEDFDEKEQTYIGIVKKEKFREEAEDAVQLMTLHASKGLEFTCVFIIGVNDGLLPLRGTGFEQEDEERRLFFVGMTRAKEQLELSYYTSPDGYGILPGPGKYLKMFPKDLIEGLDEPKYAEGNAAEHLQAMKRQILQAREERTLQMPEEDFRTISPEIDVEKPDTDPCRHEEKEENSAKSATNHTDADSAANQPRVAHEKYGVGTVISENEDTITIRFDDYGEKELLKMFTVLHPL